MTEDLQRQIAAAGTIILINEMIKIQGLEKTLEQIREIANANCHSLDNRAKELAPAAWAGVVKQSLALCRLEEMITKKKEGGGE